MQDPIDISSVEIIFTDGHKETLNVKKINDYKVISLGYSKDMNRNVNIVLSNVTRKPEDYISKPYPND
jgi:hypothetical protein